MNLLGDNFFRAVWFLATGGFLLFFFYTLFQSRRLKLKINYGVWLTVFLFLFAGTISTYMQKDKLQTQTQADLQITPKNLKAEQTGVSEAVISWQTDKKVIQTVKYKTPGKDWVYAFDEQLTTPVTSHRVHLTNLEKGKRYTIIIIAGEKEFPYYNGQQISIVIK